VEFKEFFNEFSSATVLGVELIGRTNARRSDDVIYLV